MNDRPPQVMPHDEHAERAALGAMMLDAGAADTVRELLTPDDFYVLRHQAVFRACVEAYEAGSGADLIIVRRLLEGAGDLEKVGGTGYLTDLMETPTCSANAEYYARAVKAETVKRALLQLTPIVQQAQQPGVDVDALLEQLRGGLEAFGPSGEAIPTIGEAGLKEADALMDAWALGEHVGLPTGLRPLDAALDGLLAGTLIIVGAAPREGKTALACNIALDVTERQHKPVLFFSAEMPAVWLTLNMLSMRSGVPWRKVRRGAFHPDELAQWQAAKDALRGLPLYVDDTSQISIEQIARRAAWHGKHKDVALVIVDYVQLLGTRSLSERHLQVASLSAALKGVARRNNVPVLALSQITYDKGGLPHLRWAAELEQDADVVILLARKSEYAFGAKDAEPDVAVRRFKVAKNRFGAEASFEMEFDKPRLRFREIDGEREGSDSRTAAGKQGTPDGGPEPWPRGAPAGPAAADDDIGSRQDGRDVPADEIPF